MARVIAINISAKKGVPKQPVSEGYFETDYGLRGDAHAGKWHRQVSLLAIESINKMEKMGLSQIATGDFAENITTEGLTLYQLPVGTRLKLGEVLMEITQIGKECHQGCAIRQTIGDCIMPREGIFARVLTSGSLKPGDKIEVL